MNQTTMRRNVAWRMPSITADGLKLFACITMLIQTVGIAIIEKGMIHLDQYTQTGLSEALAEDSHLMMLAGMGSVMQLVGGLAIPVFAFLLVEGFRHTSNYRNYLLSVVLFALLSEIPYDMAMSQRLADWSSQNALVSMSISLMMLYFLDMMKEKSGWMYQAARLLLVVCAVLWVTLLRAQYGFCIVLLAAVFYLFYSKPIWKTILGILISLLYVTGPLSFYGIWCYNEKRSDRLPKYVYYIFYPLHLLVLGVISMMLS